MFDTEASLTHQRSYGEMTLWSDLYEEFFFICLSFIFILVHLFFDKASFLVLFRTLLFWLST